MNMPSGMMSKQQSQQAPQQQKIVQQQQAVAGGDPWAKGGAVSGSGGWGTADTAFGVSPVFGSFSGGLGNGRGLPAGLGSIGLGGAGGGGLRGGGGGQGGGGLEAVPGIPGAGLPVGLGGLGGLGFPTVSGSAGGASVGGTGDGGGRLVPLMVTDCHKLPLIATRCRWLQGGSCHSPRYCRIRWYA